VEQAKLEKLVREQVQLQSLRAQVSSEKSRLIASLGTMPDLRGQDLRAAGARTLLLKRHAERLIELQMKCEQELSIQRKNFREAKQRFRLLEQLKERKFAEWRQEEAAQLDTLASESYLANWNRAKSGAGRESNSQPTAVA
jgi:uncharacterized protein with NAD-binding domain and iron-sulfur cluster